MSTFADKFNSLDIKDWFGKVPKSLSLFEDFCLSSDSETLFNILSQIARSFTVNKVSDVRFTNGASYASTSGVLSVDISLLGREDLTKEQRVSAFLGRFVHELGHFEFTFTPENLSEKDKYFRLRAPLGKLVMNVLEDKRMECLVVQKYPGYFKYLLDSRKYAIADQTPDFPEMDPLNYLILTVLFPALTENESFEAWAKALNDSKDFVCKKIDALVSKCNGTFKTQCYVADRLTKLLSNYQNSTSIKQASDSLGTKPQEKAKELISDLRERHEQNLFNVLNKIEDDTHGKVPSKFIQTETFKDVDPPVRVLGDPNLYNREEVEDDATKLAKQLKNVVNFYKTKAGGVATIYEQSEGDLDEEDLYQAPFNRNIFMDEVISTKSFLEIIVSLDLSGSMGISKRLRDAKTMVLALIKAFHGAQGVKIQVFGHSANIKHFDSLDVGITEILTDYKKFDLNRFLKLGCQSNNADGFAYRWMHSKFSNKKCNKLFIAISDGEPAASDYKDTLARQHTAEAIRAMEMSGIKTVSVAVANFDQSDMYKNVIPFNDQVSKNLVEFLVKELKGIAEEIVY